MNEGDAMDAEPGGGDAAFGRAMGGEGEPDAGAAGMPEDSGPGTQPVVRIIGAVEAGRAVGVARGFLEERQGGEPGGGHGGFGATPAEPSPGVEGPDQVEDPAPREAAPRRADRQSLLEPASWGHLKDAGQSGEGPELAQHWTEPPTGQIPAVLSAQSESPSSKKGSEEEAWSALASRTVSWRGDDVDWDADELEHPLLDVPAGDSVAPTGAAEAAAGPGEGGSAADDEPGESDPFLEGPVHAAVPAGAPVQVAEAEAYGARATVPEHATAGPRRARHAGAPPGGEADAHRSDTGLRIVTGVTFALITVGCLLLGPPALLVLSTVVVVLAMAECYNAFRRVGFHPATLIGILGTIGAMVFSYFKGSAAVPIVFALVAVFSLLWFLAGAPGGVVERPVVNTAVTLLGFTWVGLLGSFAGLLLDPYVYPHRHGVAFMGAAVACAVLYDVGGYAGGRIAKSGGRSGHALAPAISPNKTWEGLVGATVVAMVTALAIGAWLHPWTMGHALELGVVVSVAAPFGDLVESMVKRDLKLKDTGVLLPGHGGVLDRVDGILFVLPAAFALIQVLHVV